MYRKPNIAIISLICKKRHCSTLARGPELSYELGLKHSCHCFESLQECRAVPSLQGSRFFLSSTQLEKKSTHTSQLSWFLQHDIPLLLESPQRQQLLQKGIQKTDRVASSKASSKKEQAQLLRIWLSCPEGPLRFSSRPMLSVKVYSWYNPSPNLALGLDMSDQSADFRVVN